MTTPKTLHQEPDQYALTPASSTADALVTALEAVELGQPYAAAEESASRYVAALAESAVACVFPPFVPSTADVIATFEFYEAAWLRSEYGRRVAELHAACRDLQPGLDRFLRSEAIGARVGAAAARPGMSADQMAAASDQAVTDYQRRVTGQLIGVAGFEPSASILAVIVPALQARLDACRQRHGAHVAAESARLEQERRDAAAVVVAAEQRQRDDLVHYFRANGTRTFVVGGAVALGSALSEIARRAGAYDVDGELLKLTLSELQAAHDQAIAAAGART